VIGHYDVTVEVVVGQVPLVTEQRLYDHPGDLRAAQVKGAGADAVEQAIHGDKGPAMSGGRGEDAAWGKAAVQAPSEKDGLAGGIELRQTAGMKSHHKVRMSVASRDSQE